MNHGSFTRDLLRLTAAVTSASGTIHSARANLTVVPTIKADGPYLEAAPTTELVSWIASAAHRPNCGSVMCSAQPISGKMMSATELRIKTVPSETAISCSSACTMGPTAAMALHPQIAVRAVI